MQLFIRPAQLFFDSLAIADVANRTQHQRSFSRGDGTQADFDGKFRTITPSTMEIQFRSHAPRLRSLRELLAMMMMLATIAIGNKHFDFTANQFLALIAE